MTETRTDAATLRKLAKADGLNVRVRKGKGCRSGAIHFFMQFGATRADREAAVAFLIRVAARVSEGYGLTDLAAITPHFFDSIPVHAFEACFFSLTRRQTRRITKSRRRRKEPPP